MNVPLRINKSFSRSVNADSNSRAYNFQGNAYADRLSYSILQLAQNDIPISTTLCTAFDNLFRCQIQHFSQSRHSENLACFLWSAWIAGSDLHYHDIVIVQRMWWRHITVWYANLRKQSQFSPPMTQYEKWYFFQLKKSQKSGRSQQEIGQWHTVRLWYILRIGLQL